MRQPIRSGRTFVPPAAVTTGLASDLLEDRGVLIGKDAPLRLGRELGAVRGGELHAGGDDIVGIDAGRRVHHARHGSHEQRRADQQRASERDLPRHERGVGTPGAATASTLTRAQLDHHLAAQQHDRRHQTEHNGRDRHDRDGQTERTQIDAGFVEAWNVHRRQRHERRQGDHRREHAEQRSGNRQDQPFGEELHDQLSRGGADREAERDLPLA